MKDWQVVAILALLVILVVVYVAFFANAATYARAYRAGVIDHATGKVRVVYVEQPDKSTRAVVERVEKGGRE